MYHWVCLFLHQVSNNQYLLLIAQQHPLPRSNQLVSYPTCSVYHIQCAALIDAHVHLCTWTCTHSSMLVVIVNMLLFDLSGCSVLDSYHNVITGVSGLQA